MLYCSIGASMVVETQAVPLWLSRSYYNRFCFLQYEQQVERMLLPEDWKEVRNVLIQIHCGYIHNSIRCY